MYNIVLSLTSYYLRSWALLEEPPIVQPSRTSHHFMEPEGSIPRSQEPSTGLYPEPYQSNPATDILLLCVTSVMCLPNRCLAMDICATIWRHHKLFPSILYWITSIRPGAHGTTSCPPHSVWIESNQKSIILLSVERSIIFTSYRYT
jgi:hypothetical protein